MKSARGNSRDPALPARLWAPGTWAGRGSITSVLTLDEIDADDFAAAQALVAGAESIVVLTGAGISTDSGIPDFRGPQGVWTKDPKAEKAANISNYISDPEHRKQRWQKLVDGSVWEGKQPNDGHRALAELDQRGRLHTLVTQNVDGLHQAAGTSDERMVEIHGTTTKVKCLDCGETAPMQKALDRVRGGDLDPHCRSCDGLLKSATISFGQSLISEDLERAEQAALAADVLLCVGTTLAVYPIAHMAPIAHRNGADLIIINADPTQFDPIASHVFPASISEVLPPLLAQA